MPKKKERTLIAIVECQDGYMLKLDCRLRAAWRKQRKKWGRRWRPLLLALILLLAGSTVASPTAKSLLGRVMHYMVASLGGSQR